MGVQGAKDVFYGVLRDRVAGLNPGRTAVVRGVLRPGVAVEEAELVTAGVDGIALEDVFWLRWTELGVDAEGALPLVRMRCEVRYATAGTAAYGGLDRGRALAAMDAELAQAVGAAPMSAPLVLLGPGAGGGPATGTATGTRVFWSGVMWKPAVIRNERLERTAEIEVFCYGY